MSSNLYRNTVILPNGESWRLVEWRHNGGPVWIGGDAEGPFEPLLPELFPSYARSIAAGVRRALRIKGRDAVALRAHLLRMMPSWEVWPHYLR